VKIFVQERLFRCRVYLQFACFVFLPSGAFSADAWFGVAIPDAEPFAPEKIYAQKGFSPLQLQESPAFSRTADISAQELMEYVSDQMDISRQSKAEGQLIWGRISGRSGGRMTTQYVLDKFRDIGLEDTHLQPVTMPPQTWPDEASLTLLATAAAGIDTTDYAFRSMMPQPRTPGTGSGGITADLVYVGYGRDIDIAGKDLQGKGAVIRARPVQGGYSSVLGIPDRLAEAGAAFVIVIYDIAIDQQIYNPALSGSQVPTFAIADYEGRFMEEVMARAGGNPVQAHVMLTHMTEPDNMTDNVIGKISGTTDEYVIVVAHMDAYFYGAIDNATGVAAMLGLARHIANLPEKPRRTHIFVATGGHHAGGWPGTVQYVDSILDIREKTAIVLNCEHVAATQFIEYADIDYSVWGTTGGMLLSNTEVPKFGTVLPENDNIFGLLDQALTAYGVTLLTHPWDDARGDVYPFKDKGFPVTQIVEVGNAYHTTADILEAVSVPGLQRTTRSFAEFLHQIDARPMSALKPNTK
jgi:hypothetical protein